MEQEQEHVFVNAFMFLFPKCSLSVHEHGKERRTLSNLALGRLPNPPAKRSYGTPRLRS